MRILVTGSAGHLGEAIVRTLESTPHQVEGLDRLASAYTVGVGSTANRDFVRHCVWGADAIIHAATLHKPHLATHSRQDFIDTNVTGTLNLLEEVVAAGVGAFVFTSTTSAFGRALTPVPGAPAAWVTENVRPAPKNIYGITKLAAEDLCELFHRIYKLPCLVLRTARFFPEQDDNPAIRRDYDDANVKANEYLYRRVELQDAVDAHLLALQKPNVIGFRRYIISATTPFELDDRSELRLNAAKVLSRRAPEYEGEYSRRGWKMFAGVERVYVNERARRDLGWRPRYDFRRIIELLSAGEDPRSPLARLVGSKGYHDRSFATGPYPVQDAVSGI